MDAPIVFAYWDRTDYRLIDGFLAEWRAHFPQFAVYGDHDIEPLVASLFAGYLPLYQKIRIPAARADLARLIALYQHGGLYMDCHCGIGDIEATRRLLTEGLDKHDLILLDKDREVLPRDPAEIFPLNGVLFARARSPIILAIAHKAFENLAAHHAAEQENGFVPYDIWGLSGAGVLFDVLFQPDLRETRLREHYAGKVMFVPQETSPVRCYRHGAYREPGRHWSERQNLEPLFDLGKTLQH